MSDDRFNGFNGNTLGFFRDLEENNNREWFSDNKPVYQQEVIEPAKRFIVELGSALSDLYPTLYWGTQANGSGSLMRIYRDVRFSKDKRPYKENLGIMFPLKVGKKVEQPIFYFHIEARRCFFYGGQHMFSKEMLPVYREAVADKKKGAGLEKILKNLPEGLNLMEEPHYKRVPRGYDKDHPRADLLKYVGIGAGIPISQELLFSPKLIGRCLETAKDLDPLMQWLMKM